MSTSTFTQLLGSDVRTKEAVPTSPTKNGVVSVCLKDLLER